METLSKSWLTDGLIDFEYKKYILLAYLKHVKERFNSGKLYPNLSELIMHYNNLISIKNNKQLLFDSFPKKLSKIDTEKLKLTYLKIVEDDDLMLEIQSIINYALPLLKEHIDEETELYELIESNMKIEPVGLLPIYDKEGYIFLNEDAKKEFNIYRYQVSLISQSNESFQSISTRFIRKEISSFVKTVENIKLELIKTFSDLPNPATFLVISKLSFPITETVLPIAKRKIIRELNA